MNAKGRKKGPWRVLSSRTTYRNPWLHIVSDEVIQPRGGRGVFEVVHFRPGVGVIAVDAKNNAYFVKEFHYAVGKEMLSGVLGGLEKGEKPIIAAKRELKEELGITARKWTFLGHHDPVTMNALVPMQLYLAQDLSIGKKHNDSTEVITRVRMPLEKAVKLVLAGKMTQGSTSMLVLLARERLKKKR